MSNPSARVRPATADDEDAVVKLLVRARQWTADPERVRRLFRYDWGTAIPNRGYVVEADSGLVGFLGTVYCERMRSDGTERVCSFSFYWVDPPFRSMSLRLLHASLRQPGYTFVSLSPNANSQAILDRLGFRELSTGYYLCLPRPVMLWRRPVRLVSEDARLLPLLDDEERRIMRAHQPYGCRAYLLEGAGRRSLLVTKRRRFERAPLRVSEVIHLSDAPLALQHWDWIVARIAIAERSVAVALDQAFLHGSPPPRGIFRRRRRLYRRPDQTGGTIDALFSELVLLLD